MRPSIGACAAASAIALVAGCGVQAPSDRDPPGVVATTTQIGSVAAELGDGLIDLTVLLEPGVEAHDFELSPADAAALERADLVLVSGAGLEDWLDDTLATSGTADRVRDMSDGVRLRVLGDEEPAHAHDDDDHDEADETHDPHYWLSGSNAVILAENVRDALLELVPEERATIEERAAALVARLTEADAEVRRLMEEIPAEQRKIVTDHDALGYFVDEYGLEFVGSAFPTMDVSAEPSAREVEQLVADIQATGARAIFTESSVNPRLARAIAEEARVELVAEPLYTDSLGEPGSGAETLDGMLLHNARVIHDGLMGD